MSALTDYLSQKREEIERPKLLPIGHYTWQIMDQPDERESRDGAWGFLTYPCQAAQAEADVDSDLLEEFGTLAGVRVYHRFFFPLDPDKVHERERAAFAHRQFLEAAGLFEEEDDTVAEAVLRAKGAMFIAPASHSQNSEDPERFDLRLGTATPAE